MPETFAVDVCYDRPCHWTPPPTLTSGLDDSIRANTRPAPEDLPPLEPLHRNDHGRGAMPVVEPQPGGGPGHHHVKRAPEPQQQQQQQQRPQRPAPQGDDSRQGPPVPENPDPEDIVEPIQRGTRVEVDPDVRQQAVERVQSDKAQMKINRPPSFHDHMDTRYILRPEAIESVFYMWRITGDPKWQDKGWQMWESIESVSWTELAYSAIADVNDVNSAKADSMESFFLAETLKYFYLLYSEPDVISLDDWVFNTEAHPFRRPKVGVR